jgi:hypothetical protein
MILTPRMAFRCMEEPRHIYIPPFDPASDSDEMLIVNFTTLRESSVDEACILDGGDYSELTHRATVAFSRSLIGRKSRFCAAVAQNHFIRLDDLPEQTWEKILTGARVSPELSERKKNLLPPSR